MEKETYTWTTEQPTETGKYFVETKSMMGNTRRLHAGCVVVEVDGKVKVTWAFSNQVFVRYLKEI